MADPDDDDVHSVDWLSLQPVAESLLPEHVASDLAETFKALADGTRVRLISALVARELCVGELAALLEMSVSAVSHQLRLLHRLRIVRRRREGRHVYYSLDDEHINTMYGCGLDHLRHG